MSYQFYLVNHLSEKLKDLLITKNIDPLDIEDIFSDTNLSKAEVKKDYTYLSLQLPEYQKDYKFFEIKEIQLIFNDEYVIIVDAHKYESLAQFEQQRKQGNIPYTNSKDIAWELVDFLVTRTVSLVNRLRYEIVDFEKGVFNFETNRDFILDIQIVKKNLINFQSLISPIQDALDEIKKSLNKSGTSLTGTAAVKQEELKKIENEVLRIEDTQDKTIKILNNLQNLKEQVALITETNEVLIARSTNEVLKVLTIISILFLIPNLITSFFGMNVNFSWDTNVFDLRVILSIIASIITSCLIAFMFFKHRRWL